MAEISLPVLLADQRINARADVGVSLKDADVRGIHRSRLYLALQNLEHQPLTPPLLQQLLANFLDSHQGLSDKAYLALRGEALFSRPALVSPLSGWKAYPFELRAHQDPWGFHVELQVQPGYCSRC